MVVVAVLKLDRQACAQLARRRWLRRARSAPASRMRRPWYRQSCLASMSRIPFVVHPGSDPVGSARRPAARHPQERLSDPGSIRDPATTIIRNSGILARAIGQLCRIRRTRMVSPHLGDGLFSCMRTRSPKRHNDWRTGKSLFEGEQAAHDNSVDRPKSKASPSGRFRVPRGRDR
jgi:hypothetical protein